MRNVLTALFIILLLAAYHFFVVQPNFIRASDMAVLDINRLLVKLENDVYSEKISAEEYSRKIKQIKTTLSAEPFIILNAPAVITGLKTDLTDEYYELVK
jgi:hypothetical protein